MSKRWMSLLAVALLALAVSACKKEEPKGPLEKLGAQADEKLDEIEEAIDDAKKEKAEEDVEKAEEKLEEEKKKPRGDGRRRR